MKGFASERGRVLIVDGYNVINVRKPVRESRGLEDAWRGLTDRLHDYAGWSGQRIVLVYDAWLSDRAQRSVEKRGTLEIVFTKKGETADQYIERLCDELSDDVEMRRIELRVATSDLVEQTIAFGRGAIRMSSRELLMEMDQASAQRGPATRTPGPRGTTVAERLPPDIMEKLERMRRGEESPRGEKFPRTVTSTLGPIPTEPNIPASNPERREPAPEPNRRDSAEKPGPGEPAPEPNQRGPAKKAKRGKSEPTPNQLGSATKQDAKPNQGKSKSRPGRNRTRRKPNPNQPPAKREAKAEKDPAPANPKPNGRKSKEHGEARQTNLNIPHPNHKDARR